jgi:peptidase M23-like protein
MRFFVLVGAAALMAPAGAHASDAALDIRFCPSGQVRAYPLESGRPIESLVLQNIVIINRLKARAVITDVDLEVMRGGQAIEARRLKGQDLERAARNGAALQSSGAMKAASFLFCGDRVVGAGVKLAGPALAAGQGLLVFQQFLAFQGMRDTVRVTVRASVGRQSIETRASLPIRVGFSKTVFRFPLSGVWYVEQAATPHTPHRWAAPEEFALDICKLGGEGLDHRGAGDKFTDYYGYGAEVLAAADGRVVTAVGDAPEDLTILRRAGEDMDGYMKRLMQSQATLAAQGTTALAGNYVVIDHGDGEYSLYAHMQPGSLRVKSGDEVKAGEPVGRLGSSGNSTAPHLHFQLCDGPDPLDCAGIPIAFKGIDLPLGDFPRPVQSGDIVVAPE